MELVAIPLDHGRARLAWSEAGVGTTMPQTASVATLLTKTELQRQFPLHVVCSWLVNSPSIAQQSHLLVTEDDFDKAAGMSKLMVEGLVV